MKKLSERKKKWIERTVANDRSYKVFLYNRFVVFLLSALLQLVVYIVFSFSLVYDSKWAMIAQIIVLVLEIVFVLYIISRHERPSTRLNWIILIMLVPFFGVPMYFFNGEGRPARKINAKIQRAKKENDEKIREKFGKEELPLSSERKDAVCSYLQRYAEYPVYTDGDVEYYKSGEEMFPQMLLELKKAEKFILVEYFIIAHGKMWNSILKILVEKAMQGVQVRIIYDDFGCMMTLPPKYERYLESLHENIKCMTFNNVVPLFAVRMNNRDHRKILVVDGKVAFTGGINLADEYIAEKVRFGYWKDTGIKITGNAVRSFTEMFFYMWNAFRTDKEDVNAYLLPLLPMPTAQETSLRIQPYDDSPLDKVSVGETVYLDMITRASKYVYVFTPYLILNDFLRAALCQAAMRGVDVRIVTPGIPDKKVTFRLTRANYQMLLKAGVKIYEYTPGFIHAKSMVCDDESAVVGTINLDYRSLYLHFENAVYFSDCKAVADLKRDCEETFAVSKLCTLENTKQGIFGRLVDSVLRVFETLM
ncbi:MAG: cardiolipin synthase [Clostridia bacterium]|nr:cardiolipin synthase [Clostridia bacterium]